MRNILRYYSRILKTRYFFWKERRYTGEYELLILPALVDSNKIAIDVGGNIGSYTHQLSKLAARVVTFEPNPGYVQRIQALRLRNVTIEEVALSDHSGVAHLRIPMSAGGYEDQGMASIESQAIPDESVARTLDVPTRRLDDYNLDQVGFIKIDVEGHEEAVLAGARRTLQRSHPAILVEVEEQRNPGSIERIRASLAELGYAGYYYENGSRRPIETFDVARHQPADLVWDKYKHTRRTFPLINNFLFLPRR